jgi:hypothetical protein
VYREVGGYGGGRLYNPDKWFHWKIISRISHVYYLDLPLFQYRWHINNQESQQKQNKALNYWVDEYRNSIEITNELLAKAEFSRETIQQVFIRRCIFSNVYNFSKLGDIYMAKRLLSFGYACYPAHCKSIFFYCFKVLMLFPLFCRMTFKIIAFLRK